MPYLSFISMVQDKNKSVKEKNHLHPRNKHLERYDFAKLIASNSELAQFVSLNIHNDQSIDFFNPIAVKMLNKALLKAYYDIQYWDIPPHYLCPPIPSRANYIHYVADLLRASNYGKIPIGSIIKCLDIGVGANCVYPIIGVKEYGWSFVGADIDSVSIASVNKIIENNTTLHGKVACRIQPNAKDIFVGIIQKDEQQKDEQYDLTICNPPFHASQAEAKSSSIRKLSNLKQKKITTPILNFGGQQAELWCEGGEEQFVTNMINQSKQFGNSCFWFSTLISKQSILKRVEATLKNMQAVEVKIIPMGQGNKTSRVVAWTFLTKAQQMAWANSKWNKQLKV